MQRRLRTNVTLAAVLAGSTVLSACAAGSSDVTTAAGGEAGAAQGGAGGAQAGTGGSGASGGGIAIDAGVGGAPSDPCDPQNPLPSYVGCDFWPTVTTNGVWDVFDFAVVVANAGDEIAHVDVEKDGKSFANVDVKPGALEKIYLPWVPELKYEAGNSCGTMAAIQESVRAQGGAYHLKSSAPVSVYQFNPLEYRGQGGPTGKSWDACPGNDPCFTNDNQPVGCYSFTNDASLLLPSTAWTGNYRITAQRNSGQGNFVAITAASDTTTVLLKLSETADVQSGANIQGGTAGQSLTLTLDAGDVIQLIGGSQTDLSGSLLQADKPVQVLSGVRCTQEPVGTPACDHLEEVVLPAETLGSHYLVTVPTGALGNVVGHRVRIYGSSDGTALTYLGNPPAGAPAKLDAGDVVDLENVTLDFEIVGSAPFAVGSFMLGGKLQDPPANAGDEDYQGDPSQSTMIPVEQFRKKYVFLAPDDYDTSYVDVAMPTDTTLEIDGVAVTGGIAPISPSWSVARVKLGPGQGGAHVLEASAPVGIQVMGYGSFTSYQFPGGSNLEKISPPPVK